MKNVYDADRIYERYVSREGLYDKAYFGHAPTPAQARRMNRLWKKAQREARRNSQGKEG